MNGFNEAETTFQIWTGKGSNRDFKEAARYALSEAGNLELVPEGGQFPQDVFGEASARTKVATYGKIFSLTKLLLMMTWVYSPNLLLNMVPLQNAW